MHSLTLSEVLQILQLSLAPVILISGVGLLILSLTNRLGRSIDRSRALAKEKQGTSDENTIRGIDYQIGIIYRRAKILRLSIAMAILSILSDSILVICVFIFTIFGLNFSGAVIFFFSLCLVFLITSLIAFAIDIDLSLKALKEEISVK